MDAMTDGLNTLLDDVTAFTLAAGGLRLRRYQEEVARCVVRSVREQLGLGLVVMFPRQSGKNELQAQIEAYLLVLFQFSGAEMVKVSPTWKPQTLNAMRRLQRVLESNALTAGQWEKESGYIFRLGQARIFFFSGAPEANIVGATASTLLEVDEAQDVRADKFDKDIAPMAASTNATRVFWGTAWTPATLLGRELRAARLAEQADGLRRTFVLTAEQVAAEVPAYGRFVAAQVAKMGRNHPLIRTQFFSEELEGGGGMFTPERLEKMQAAIGWGARQGEAICFLLDIAGEENGPQGQPSGRDSTALTIVAVDPQSVMAPLLRAPTYRVVQRRLWTGVKHTALYAELLGLAQTWRPRWLVVDATGVGAGLASFLARALPGKVICFTFNTASKSRLGWKFLEMVDEGRFCDPGGAASEQAALRTDYFRQLGFCQYEILPGPGRLMRWGVPDGTRDPVSGEAVHDDLVISAALCAVLDEQGWGANAPAAVVPGRDPIVDMDRGF